MNALRKFIPCLVLCVFVAVSGLYSSFCTDAAFPAAFADEAGTAASETEQAIEGIIGWGKSKLGVSDTGTLIGDEFLRGAGTSNTDWFVFGLGRYGAEDNYNAYLAVTENKVSQAYRTEDNLDAKNATEWHRLSLAINAAKGDARQVGEADGQPIDLIEDGTYGWTMTSSPGTQGINGWIWGLLALDSKRYEVPDGAAWTRADFIEGILKLQMPDNGFAWNGMSADGSDVDVTAMAVQALSPYYNSEIEFEYTYAYKNGGQTVSRKVREVVDEAMEWLSAQQLDAGDFESDGVPNAESTAWAMLAAVSVGIDPLSDPRFLSDGGKSVFDGLMRYRAADGGFAHSLKGGQEPVADFMASGCVLYGLAGLYRYQNGKRNVFDLRSEFTADERDAVNALNQKIASFDENTAEKEIKEALQGFRALNPFDRYYITDYKKLSEYARLISEKMPDDEALLLKGADFSGEEILYRFSDGDKSVADLILSMNRMSSKYEYKVLELLRILKYDTEFPQRGEYIRALEDIRNEIEDIKKEIAAIKKEIAENLYPVEELNIFDKKMVDDLWDRYESLNEYDRENGFSASELEALERSKTRINNLTTELIVWVSCAAAAVGIAAFLFIFIRKRRRRKAEDVMQESDE